MNIKNNKRYKSNSEKIETAFLALLLTKNYEDVSISDICKRAEINRSTFYTHYNDINDLIVTIESKFASSMSAIFNFGLRQSNQAFIEMFTFVKQNKFFYKAFLNIPYTTLAEKNAKGAVLEKIKSISCVNMDEISLLYRSSFFGAGVKEICKLWLERDCKESPEQMAEILKKEYTNRSENDLFE